MIRRPMLYIDCYRFVYISCVLTTFNKDNDDDDDRSKSLFIHTGSCGNINYVCTVSAVHWRFRIKIGK